MKPELRRCGYHALQQEPVSFTYNEMRFDRAFRLDLLIEGRLVVEIKSVERIMPVHTKQLLTYLRLIEQPLRLLKNFGGETLKEGLRRVVNNYSFAP